MDALLVLLIAIEAAVDQLSKKWALWHFRDIGPFEIKKPLITLRIVKNRGAALGILENRVKVLIVSSGAALTIVIYSLLISIIRNESVLTRLSLSLIVGGALSNLLDRVRFGYVIDFFSFNFRKSPVFNLADIFIFTGVAALEAALIFNIS